MPHKIPGAELHLNLRFHTPKSRNSPFYSSSSHAIQFTQGVVQINQLAAFGLRQALKQRLRYIRLRQGAQFLKQRELY